MSKKRKVLVGLGIFVALFALLYIEANIYPLSSRHPNFADVERVFNRMQFPADWQETRSSENRGIAGRQCPIEPATRCFHKSKTFKIPSSIEVKSVEKILLTAGCTVVTITDNTYSEELKKSYNLECSIEGLDISGAYRGPEQEVYVSVGT